MVSIHLTEPAQNGPGAYHILNWTETVSLRGMIEKIETYLKNEGILTEKDKLNPDDLLVLMQSAIRPTPKA